MIRKLLVGVIGAAAVAAGLLLVKQQRPDEADSKTLIPPGETVPGRISLERIRELGV